MCQSRRGLSLLELVIVVLILGAIATYAMVRISMSRTVAQEKACRHNVAQINSALERYAVVNDGFPVDLTPLETNDYFPEGIPVCPVSGNPYALNTTTNHVDGHDGSVHP